MTRIALLAGAAIVIATAPASAQSIASNLTFQTIDDPADPTFNQLLGINNNGVIAGYFGSGQAGHPNQGYTIKPPYATFKNANVPGSVQTQAVGINAEGTICGFWSGTNFGTGDANFGFVRWREDGRSRFLLVNDPAVGSVPPVNQVLGINNFDQAVGFYNDVNNNSHGFEVDVRQGRFVPVTISGATSVQATGIDSFDIVSGFAVDAKGLTIGFLKPLYGGPALRFAVPGATATQFFGVNDHAQAIGTFTDAQGGLHGLMFNPFTGKYVQIDDPNGIGTTTLNGLNDRGQAVGFYTDGANVHGMLVSGLR